MLRYILQINKELDENKKGQISKKNEFVTCGGAKGSEVELFLERFRIILNPTVSI